MDTLDAMDSLPEIGSKVSLMHPLYELPTQGTIATYTCSESFDQVDGVNVLVHGDIIECRLSDVEVA
jgi:hypothetical protein